MERFLIGEESEILVGRGLPDPLLPPRDDRMRAAVISQPGAARQAEDVAGRLGEEAVENEIHLLPDGENAKTLNAIEEAYGWLAERAFGRGDTIVAVGGGAVTDAAGFVAATWMRGVEAIYFPTTLLGAVDAAIGGKTGVNVGGKNLVGAFRHPRRVVVDLSVLDELPAELKRQGAAEIIKAGLLASPDIVAAYLREGLDVSLDEVVPAAVRVKADIVNEDFTEQGRRGLLNLGHTIGHGIEFASNLSHGDSVAIGLVAAAAVSERLLGFSESETVEQALQAAGLPTRAPALDRSDVLRLIGLDKKRVADRTRMALLEATGRPLLREVEDADIAHGLSAIGL